MQHTSLNTSLTTSLNASLIASLIALGVALLLLTGCGNTASRDQSANAGSPPTTTSTPAPTATPSPVPTPTVDPIIPLFPGATAAPSDSTVSILLQSLGEQMNSNPDVALSVEGYALPDDTPFTEVKAFYDEALALRGYTEADDIDNTGITASLPDSGTSFWVNEGAGSVFSVFVLPDPGGTTTPYLIITRGTDT